MAVDFNGPVSGHITEIEGTINAVFPPTQEILITSEDDSISIGDADGTLADVTAANALKTDSSHVTQHISAASLPLPALAATSTNQDAERVLLGAVTETAPASDTASSGLNGRLQRIAQHLTSLLGRFPTVLGQLAMANSLSVVIANNQTAVPFAPARGSLVNR